MSYSGLSDYVMCQKLDSFLEEDIPNEIKEEIIKVLKDFDRAKSEYLCFEIESLINKPHIDIEEIINLHVFDEIKHEEDFFRIICIFSDSRLLFCTKRHQFFVYKWV